MPEPANQQIKKPAIVPMSPVKNQRGGLVRFLRRVIEKIKIVIKKASGVIVADMPKIIPRISIIMAKNKRGCFLAGCLATSWIYGILKTRVMSARGT